MPAVMSHGAVISASDAYFIAAGVLLVALIVAVYFRLRLRRRHVVVEGFAGPSLGAARAFVVSKEADPFGDFRSLPYGTVVPGTPDGSLPMLFENLPPPSGDSTPPAPESGLPVSPVADEEQPKGRPGAGDGAAAATTAPASPAASAAAMLDNGARRPDAGWYPDPLGSAGRLRFWDGAVWTAHVAEPAS